MMPLQINLFLNNERMHQVLARRQREEVVGEKRSSFAAPVYLMIDRSVEMLKSQSQFLWKKYTVDEWKFLIDALNPSRNPSMRLSEVPGIVAREISSATMPPGFNLHFWDIMSPEMNWAILDVVERFHAAGDIAADADGLKKLGILCKEN